jgi:integrase/recombinase XerD
MAGRRALPQTLSAEEVAALMARCNLGCPTGLRDRCALALMHRCGLRVSEVCGLHLRDVRWKESAIHLRSEVTKGGREAVIYMDGPTQDLLRRWVEVRRRYAAGRPWLLTTLAGGPLSRQAVWQMTARRARRAGIAHAHPHMLRHTFATELLAEGFSILEVQRLLRHSDLRTTAIYLHLVDVDLAAKVRRRGSETRG